MHRLLKGRFKNKSTSGILGPGADEALAPLATPEIKRRVLIAHLVDKGRCALQQYIGLPLGRVALNYWMQNKAASRHIEAFGLPRHVLKEVLDHNALTLHVDPRKLIQIAVHAPRKVEKRPSSLAFIWEGTWDQRREDLRIGSRYKLISELDENRNQLERTTRFKKLIDRLESGDPWASHQQGVLLDTPEKVHDYLNIYLDFLDDMAANGFDPSRGKDPIGVAISRQGRILKVNRGLHRLAMAQRIGLPSIPVRVQHVHRLWWNRVTQGATGELALKRMQKALRYCVPEVSPGPLDERPVKILPNDFWPVPRLPS